VLWRIHEECDRRLLCLSLRPNPLTPMFPSSHFLLHWTSFSRAPSEREDVQYLMSASVSLPPVSIVLVVLFWVGLHTALYLALCTASKHFSSSRAATRPNAKSAARTLPSRFRREARKQTAPDPLFRGYGADDPSLIGALVSPLVAVTGHFDVIAKDM
jgi:hypothetical protein